MDFKELHRKPLFYYLLIPAVAGIWPLWLATAGITGAKADLQAESQRYVEAEKLIAKILNELDPQRLDYAMAKKSDDDFDYTTAVDQVTKFCKIPPDSYRLSSSPVRKMRGGQKSQDASLSIEQMDIERFARFLSIMNMRWANLQCTNCTLTKIKNQKNLWKTDVRFMYYQ